jgi:hypothetical protein
MTMRRLYLTIIALGVTAGIGCNQGAPGGPGVTGETTTVTSQKPVLGLAEETFSITVPVLPLQLKQGESKIAVISLNRGKNFDEDVTLKFGKMPQGITVDPANPVILHGKTEADIAFRASGDAAVGNFSTMVTGHPSRGEDATNTIRFVVAEKKVTPTDSTTTDADSNSTLIP